MFDLVSVESTLLQANSSSPYLSPLLMTKLLWFMDRWAGSYLMPNLREYFEVALSPNLTRCYATTSGSAGGVGTPTTPVAGAGAAGAGASGAPSGRFASADGIAEFISQTAVLSLALWPSEPACATQALDCLQVRRGRRVASSVPPCDTTLVRVCCLFAAPGCQSIGCIHAPRVINVASACAGRGCRCERRHGTVCAGCGRCDGSASWAAAAHRCVGVWALACAAMVPSNRVDCALHCHTQLTTSAGLWR